jgi:hypothetical protein
MIVDNKVQFDAIFEVSCVLLCVGLMFLAPVDSLMRETSISHAEGRSKIEEGEVVSRCYTV